LETLRKIFLYECSHLAAALMQLEKNLYHILMTRNV